MDLAQIFENAIARQENLKLENAFRFDDETQAEFDAKVARRLKSVCVGLGSTDEYPRVKEICPGQSVVWQGYKIARRRVDELDNIYISRA